MKALRFVVLPLFVLACGAVERPDGGKGLLPVGALAPDVSAVDQNGQAHHLTQERGHPVVVYFYPKDGTPGCTKEACAFRDAWDKYKAAGVAIYGVSADDQKSHDQFAKEQHIPFPLVVDPDHKWSDGFGVPVRFGMDSRITFLLGPEGTVVKIYPDVDPGLHADQVLRDAAAAK